MNNRIRAVSTVFMLLLCAQSLAGTNPLSAQAQANNNLAQTKIVGGEEALQVN